MKTKEKVIELNGRTRSRSYRISSAEGWVDVHALGAVGWSRVFQPAEAIEIARAMIECATFIIGAAVKEL